MTKEEFMAEWCAKMSYPLSVFDKERVALPCYCGGNACKGWKSLRNDPDRIAEHMEFDGLPHNGTGDA